MKAVMLSIRPEWCEKIALDFKTIEVRKSKPKLETPFKCYIYCTKDKYGHLYRNDTGNCREEMPLLYIKHNATSLVPKGYINGTVIGEFVCDDVFEIKIFDNKSIRNWNFYNLADACIPYDDLAEYIGANKTGYGWHISDLFIYDTPKELSEFIKPCPSLELCEYCDEYFEIEDRCCNTALQIRRPPQSWCYVEELT